MKQYKAIFFDWDGTAVLSRKAPVNQAVAAMKPLLQKGVKLVIVSGTTMENIAQGKIGELFTREELRNLYLGLGRGAYNYTFDEQGKAWIFHDELPAKETLLDIHRVCFDIHAQLLEQYNLPTDIVFTRPNYCKIDLMVEQQRGDNLFMQGSEIEQLRKSLDEHGIIGGLEQLLSISVETGKRYGMKVKPTCDAKYLEVGISDKSDNVNRIFQKLQQEFGIKPEECSFWGDEFVGAEPGIFGSDSFMQTEMTRPGDFFDVSQVPGQRPEGVQVLGGGVECFLSFLRSQGKENI